MSLPTKRSREGNKTSHVFAKPQTTLPDTAKWRIPNHQP
jgi:hypothetical protein